MYVRYSKSTLRAPFCYAKKKLLSTTAFKKYFRSLKKEEQLSEAFPCSEKVNIWFTIQHWRIKSTISFGQRNINDALKREVLKGKDIPPKGQEQRHSILILHQTRYKWKLFHTSWVKALEGFSLTTISVILFSSRRVSELLDVENKLPGNKKSPDVSYAKQKRQETIWKNSLSTADRALKLQKKNKDTN